MEGYGPETYGDRWAGVYDEWTAEAGVEVDAAVELLAELAGSGSVLELAIGTGRIALPLAERDLDVHGIDVSEAMVARLRAKPGGDRIPVTMGNFADVAVEGTFSLVFLVFNTIFALESQEEQVRCFENVAGRLEPGGAFLVEAFVPDMTRFDRGQRAYTSRVELDSVHLGFDRHDPVRQVVESQHVVVQERGTRLLPVRVRYAWPAELDLMARPAGLRLRERRDGWRREPFTASSAQHVSVYGRD